MTLEEAREQIPWHPSHIGDCVGPKGDYIRFGTDMKNPELSKKQGKQKWFIHGAYSIICRVTDFGDWTKTLHYRPMGVAGEQW